MLEQEDWLRIWVKAQFGTGPVNQLVHNDDMAHHLALEGVLGGNGTRQLDGFTHIMQDNAA